MKISLIVAYADNRVIGKDNQLPWHLPEDLKHFKAVTLGKPIIMGRKTWESLGRPLPKRMNIVITRNDNYQAEGATVVDSLETAIAVAIFQAQRDGVNEVMVIGGATIYQQALDIVDRLYITQVHLNPDGDAYFPELVEDEWQVTEHQACQAENGTAYSLVVYERMSTTHEGKSLEENLLGG